MSRTTTTRWKETEHHVHVRGTIWEGTPDCTYDYDVREDEIPRTLEEAAKLAGDFRGLDSAEYVRVVRDCRMLTKELK
jgi:hypothetical protein